MKLSTMYAAAATSRGPALPSVDEDRRATAFHEAGHAVAAIKLGVPFGFVSMREVDDASAGRVKTFSMGPAPSDIERLRVLGRHRCEADARKRAIVAYAGFAAQSVLLGQDDHDGAASDYQDAREAATALFAEEEMTAWLQARFAETERLVGSCRRQIEVLAAALLEHVALTEDEAKALLR